MPAELCSTYSNRLSERASQAPGPRPDQGKGRDHGLVALDTRRRREDQHTCDGRAVLGPGQPRLRDLRRGAFGLACVFTVALRFVDASWWCIS